MHNWWLEDRGPCFPEFKTWWGTWPCSHVPEIPCHILSILYCCQNCLLQEVSADRQFSMPTGNPSWADNFINSRWLFSMAGLHFLQPMVFHSVQGTCSRTLAIFREAGQCKQRRQWYGTDLPGETGSSMHHSRIPRRGLWPPFFFAFILLIN